MKKTMRAVKQLELGEQEGNALLGLPEDADPDEVDAVYEELQSFLHPARIPPVLKAWAGRQRQLAAEAYESVSDEQPRAARGGARHNGRSAHSARAARRRSDRSVRRQRSTVPPGLVASTRRALRREAKSIAVAAVAALLAVGIFFGAEHIQQDSAETVQQSVASAEQFPPLDSARVSALEAKVQADPNDKDALFELGERHFESGRWQDAIDWFMRLTAVDPGNIHARTDIGTSHFNLGRYDEARSAWTEGLKLAPDDPQLHYNLGFLHANGRPQDAGAAKGEWEQVLKLAPGTQLAVAAQRDLDELQRQQSQPLAPAQRP